MTPEIIWFLIGLVLIMAEFALPAIIIVFFGLGAWVTAIATWLGLTSSPTSQNLVFIVSSVALLFLLRNRFKKTLIGTTENHALEDEFINKIATAITAIDENNGRLEFKGAEWQARSSSPIEKHAKVIIQKREGLIFHVKQHQSTL